VLVAVDLGAGQPVALGRVNEYDPQAVHKWLAPLVKRLGVSVIVTDDLLTYCVIAQKLGLENQVCQFHLRRWVGRTLHELRNTVPKDRVWVVEQTQQLIKELPQDDDRCLYETLEESRYSEKGFRSSAHCPGAITQSADPLERELGQLPLFRLAAGCPLDEQHYRAGVWSYEDAQSHRQGL